MKKIKAWFKKPGVFSKAIVLFCLAYSVRIIEWSIREFEETQMEASTLLTVSLALFGGELLFLCLKRVFAKQDKKENIQPFSQDEFDGQE